MSEVSTSNKKQGFRDWCKNWRAKIRGHYLITRKQQKTLVKGIEAEFAHVHVHIGHLNSQILHAIARIETTDYLLALPSLATSAPLSAKIPIEIGSSEEVCLFVSFAAEPTVKPHVIDHVRALLDEGVAVVLIINTAHSPDKFSLQADLASRLSGWLIRANVGFDFAAWAHAFSLLRFSENCRRLYLINDSIVGPLAVAAYSQMLGRIRRSSADLIGPTENRCPQPHLQSYYLVVNQRLLRSSAFERLMHGILNLPTKADVIAQYETQITRFLCAQGFGFEALYPQPAGADYLSDPTLYSWVQLIEDGLPFIKTRILNAKPLSPDVVRLVPQRYLPRPDALGGK